MFKGVNLTYPTNKCDHASKIRCGGDEEAKGSSIAKYQPDIGRFVRNIHAESNLLGRKFIETFALDILIRWRVKIHL